MRHIASVLEKPFFEVLDARCIAKNDQALYLKWLRYYLDFCSKYTYPPRDSDSLEPFLLKLTAKQQSPEQQKQAVESVSIYYELIEKWKGEAAAGMVSPIEDDPWAVYYQKLKEEIALRHYSPKTFKTYRGWICQFQAWLKDKDPDTVDSADARGFLTHLALDRHVAASTQNQAFNALLFLYRHIFKKEYDIGDKVARAKRTKYIPVVLSRGEVDQVLNKLRLPYRLMVQLLYGCGLRMAECINLRVQDLNFDQGIITVHDGKGGKDRTVPLPRFLIPGLQEQLERVEVLHAEDLLTGYDGVFMPTALGRKWPGAAKELIWQWVFPATRLTLVPKNQERRRYHVHESKLQKALRGAVKRSDVRKRVTCHTFRHSFASHLLRANYDIRTIQQLLGHADVHTTMIYTHTVRSRTLKEAESPLDFSDEMIEMLEGFEGGVLS